MNACLMDLQLTKEEQTAEAERDDNVRRRAHFYVYCDANSCRNSGTSPIKTGLQPCSELVVFSCTRLYCNYIYSIVLHLKLVQNVTYFPILIGQEWTKYCKLARPIT